MKFPQDYPYSPPTIRFLTKVWHPNVYEVSVSFTFITFTCHKAKEKEEKLFVYKIRISVVYIQFRTKFAICNYHGFSFPLFQIQ